jgi:hypothetical protein
MSYEEISEVLEISLGTVKSRLTRGREALRQRLARYVSQANNELGLVAPNLTARSVTAAEAAPVKKAAESVRARVSGGGRKVEVMP